MMDYELSFVCRTLSPPEPSGDGAPPLLLSTVSLSLESLMIRQVILQKWSGLFNYLFNFFFSRLPVDSADGAVDVQCVYSLWVAYYEIYNEQVYDLLQPVLSNKTKRRAALRLCEDSAGNSYVRGDILWSYCATLCEGTLIAGQL